jgi:hypothetical protein
MNLMQALDYWQVEPQMDVEDAHPEGWFPVSSGKEGIVALFHSEIDANRYRLFMVTLECNPKDETEKKA